MMKNESGQAALVIVLILLVLGALIIGVLLAFMGTGLKAGQAHEERTQELYAADAGIEDALWKLKNDQVPSDPYFLTVNDKDVKVEVVLEQDIKEFLEELLNMNYSGVHSEWTVIEEVVGGDTYKITITYEGEAVNKTIRGVGAWLEGSYGYVQDSAQGITDAYPDYSFELKPYKGGTAFIWEWTGSGRPQFGKKTGVYTRSQTFRFTPSGEPSFHFSWVYVGSADIGGVTGAVTFEIWKVNATATDSTTGKETEIIAYVSRRGEGASLPVSILTWEVSLQ